MKAKLITGLLLVCSALLPAQTFDIDSVPHYIYTDEVTMAGSALKWTIQLPVKSERSTYLIGIAVECDEACVVTQTKDGTAATATEVDAVPLNLTRTPVARFYRLSDSTGGTALTPFPILAGLSRSLTMKVVLRRATATVQNYSVSVLGASGKARIYALTAER